MPENQQQADEGLRALTDFLKEGNLSADEWEGVRKKASPFPLRFFPEPSIVKKVKTAVKQCSLHSADVPSDPKELGKFVVALHCCDAIDADTCKGAIDFISDSIEHPLPKIATAGMGNAFKKLVKVVDGVTYKQAINKWFQRDFEIRVETWIDVGSDAIPSNAKDVHVHVHTDNKDNKGIRGGNNNTNRINPASPLHKRRKVLDNKDRECFEFLLGNCHRTNCLFSHKNTNLARAKALKERFPQALAKLDLSKFK